MTALVVLTMVLKQQYPSYPTSILIDDIENIEPYYAILEDNHYMIIVPEEMKVRELCDCVIDIFFNMILDIEGESFDIQFEMESFRNIFNKRLKSYNSILREQASKGRVMNSFNKYIN